MPVKDRSKPKPKRKDFERMQVTQRLLQTMTRWEMQWMHSTRFSETPLEGTSVALLRHKIPPSSKVPVPEFIDMHLKRVMLQKKIAETPSPNTALRRVRGFAVPILAGFDASKREFVTIMEYEQTAKPFPKTPGPVEYVALERALSKIWSFGFQLTSLDLSKVSISTSLNVTLYDSSSLVGKQHWLSKQFANATPSSPSPVRYETLYAPGGNATVLKSMYEKLPPRLNPRQRNQLVNTARTQLWSAS